MGANELQLLLDQGLPRDAATALRAAGIACTHVGELGMAAASDLAIIEWAREHDRVVVTLDADFHTILVVQRATRPSVIRLRFEGLKANLVAELVDRVLARYASELTAGCLLTVKHNKTTCRLLAAD